MKLSILTLALALTTSQAFAGRGTETYKCFLDSVAYKQAPIVTVSVEKLRSGDVVTLEFNKSSTDWKPVLVATVKDNTDDVLALYENIDLGISLSFYMDESDMMGFMEGSIKSPVMNGDVKCVMAN